MTKKSQLTKEALALENEHKTIIQISNTRKKIFCGSIFLKKIYEEQDPEFIRILIEELKKAPVRTQKEFPEFLKPEVKIKKR